MSAKHTPGPWTQHEGEVRAKNYGLISRSYYGKPDGEGAANARLIAASPELLEAAQHLSGWIEVLLHALDTEMDGFELELSNPQTGASETIRLKEHFENASAAIAKAIG